MQLSLRVRVPVATPAVAAAWDGYDPLMCMPLTALSDAVY